MYRILYHDLAGNFNILNAETSLEMERSAFDIASSPTCRIICIYDYYHKKALFKCLSYDLYVDVVDELVYENKKIA
jgi:hypothetical protein